MKNGLPGVPLHLGMSLAVLMLVAIAVGLYAADQFRAACELPVVEKASFLLMHQLDRFDPLYQFATSAAPSLVVRPLAVLQQILMDAQQVEVPGCLATAKADLLASTGTVRDAFLAYEARQEKSLRALVAQSDIHYEQFQACCGVSAQAA